MKKIILLCILIVVCGNIYAMDHESDIKLAFLATHQDKSHVLSNITYSCIKDHDGTISVDVSALSTVQELPQRYRFSGNYNPQTKTLTRTHSRFFEPPIKD